MTIHLDRVAEAIEETERQFSLDGLRVPLPLSAKFNGRILGRDSKIPKTTFRKPLELFKGIFYDCLTLFLRWYAASLAGHTLRLAEPLGKDPLALTGSGFVLECIFSRYVAVIAHVGRQHGCSCRKHTGHILPFQQRSDSVYLNLEIESFFAVCLRAFLLTVY